MVWNHRSTRREGTSINPLGALGKKSWYEKFHRGTKTAHWRFKLCSQSQSTTKSTVGKRPTTPQLPYCGRLSLPLM